MDETGLKEGALTAQQIANAIADAIHEGIRRSIPLDVKLWTVEHIAEYLNRTICKRLAIPS